MSLCASCGLQLSGDTGLCPHHHCVQGDDWAVTNRLMCDFFHRGIVPPRLGAHDRDDDFWGYATDTASARLPEELHESSVPVAAA
jgi:hypothetical protein